MFKFIILIFLISLNTFAFQPHQAKYKVSYNGLNIGFDNRKLTSVNDLYHYSSMISSKKELRLIYNYLSQGDSYFTIDKNGIVSRNFDFKEYKNGSTTKDINFIFKDKNLKSNLDVDSLNLFLAIAYSLKNNKPLVYKVITKNNTKFYNFNKKIKQKIFILGKKIDVIGISSKNLKAYFAPKYQFLPVLIKDKNWKYELYSYENSIKK